MFNETLWRHAKLVKSGVVMYLSQTYQLEMKVLTITVDVASDLSLSTHSLPRFCLCLLIHITLSRKSLMKQLSYMSHSVQGATFVWHGECKPVIYPNSRKELLIDAYCNTEAPSYPMLLHTVCHWKDFASRRRIASIENLL